MRSDMLESATQLLLVRDSEGDKDTLLFVHKELSTGE